MPAVWQKIDPGLAEVYADYLAVRDRGPRGRAVHPVVEAGVRPSVFVHFTTDVEKLEALGFECVWQKDANNARGTIDLADLERLAEHPGVHRILFGRELDPLLDVSVRDIKANRLWTRTGSVFRPARPKGATGAGAIVGIIDTGIDFHHAFFMGESPATTRIRRIWDQGLEAIAGEKEPDARLLSGGSGGGTYGVEYQDVDHINPVLGGAPDNIRHRDCDGHGTHVASIAAGDGRAQYQHVGVAPRADLVVVKGRDLEKPPTGKGGYELFIDAVSYILNVAEQELRKPVVINLSAGYVLGPHDGLTDEEIWLGDRFKHPAVGRVFVAGAGNLGGQRRHARIELPANEEVAIPLNLVDGRGGYYKVYRKCQEVDGTDPLEVDLWYRNGGPELSAKLDLPHTSSDASAPALGVGPKEGYFDQKQHWRAGHSVERMSVGGVVVTRNHLSFKITPAAPAKAGDPKLHSTGRYTLKLEADGPLEVHLWCGGGEGFGFKVGVGAPPEVDPANLGQIASPGGAANILTVANYDTGPGRPIADTSSRGPLVSYVSGSAPVPPPPDLAAPGVNIDAANSQHAPDSLNPVATFSRRLTRAKNGTSMSAPHVAGAVALMLAEKPTLTAKQVKEILCAEADKVPPVYKTEGGAGRLNAEKAFLKASLLP
jgi:subtilisin family serine protease